MSLARISKAAQRSRLAQSSGHRAGPNGFQRNPQDFQELRGSSFATRQTLLNRHWHYLPARLLNKVSSLTTTFKGVPVDSNGQFQLGVG